MHQFGHTLTALALAPVAILLTGACDPGSGTGSLAPTPASAPAVVARLQPQVEGTMPHDATAFTEGLEVHDGVVYESTGMNGTSWVQRRDLASGQVLAQAALTPDLFGEGITVAGDKLWQLTWKNGVAIERDPVTLAERGRVPLRGLQGQQLEGWGACFDGTSVVTSDGSATLTFRDPATLAAQRTVDVTRDGAPVRNLNELECLPDGKVAANVWMTTDIVRADLGDGGVDAVVDAGALPAQLPPQPIGAPPRDVLNGIAALPDGTFLLTGKYWPQMFVVRFVG